MNKPNTGGVSAAHAERVGRPSRNGSPIATAPPARKKARRLMAVRRVNGSGEKVLPRGVVR
jgi:hypothetical protein